jgi:hypothetical protein
VPETYPLAWKCYTRLLRRPQSLDAGVAPRREKLFQSTTEQVDLVCDHLIAEFAAMTDYAARERAMAKAKPIHRRRVVGRPVWRVPESGYVAPRLQQSELKSAIGFVHEFGEASEADA